MSKNMEQTALRRKITAWITLGIFLVEPMSALGAPIMPDTKAPAVHQPLVQETANGVPLVNITAPTASGVSRNQYEAFNVPVKGAILNNSYTLSETKLAGFVQGNQNMVKGPATIIVNEVTSANPTAMNGFLEVAGSKASVVIANPNGITVNGGGFINMNQAMLTTGKPIFDATGNLQRLEVTKGQITVEGTGLDARTTSKLDILTRAATMNAGVWGQDINVITGANQVTYETLGTTPIGTAEQEGVALDVGAIGGMYANRIMLIGTARGMGVNMAGRIESDTTLTLDAAGNLHNTGYMQSKGTEAITVRNLTNTGTLATEEIQQIQAEQVQNSGHMVAKAGQTITGHDLTNSGVISSEGTQQLTLQDVTNTGTIYGNTEQIVEARHVINQGRIYSDGNQHLTATSVANEGTIHSQGHQIIAVTDMVTNTKTGTLASKGAQQLTSTTLRNEGILQTEEAQTLNAQTLTNTGTVQAKQDQAIMSPNLTNSGTIYSGQNQELQAETITNTGTVYAKGEQQTTTGTLATHNTWGSQGAMKLVVRDSLTNGGLVAAGLTEEGQLTGQSHLNVSAVAVDNAKSQVLSSGQLMVNTQRLNNTDGYVGSQGDMTLTAKEALTNTQGTLVSDGDIHVTAPNITNERGQLTAKGTATMSSQTVNNQSGRITSIEATTIQAKEVLQNTRGIITSQGNLTVTTPSVQLDGILAAGTDAVITTTGDITNRNSVDGYGITSAGRHLTIKTTGTIDNEKNIEAGGTLTIQAKGLVQGAHAESNGRDVDLQVATIDNVGLIQADQQLTIGSQTITNHSTGRIYGEAIHMETSSLDNYTDKALEAKLATELAQLKVRETALNAAFAVDVTGFTTRDEEAAYKAKIAEETAKYETQLAVVKDIAAQLAALPAGTIAGRTSVAITGDTLRNSNHSLIYSGGDMTLVGKHSIENAEATIEAIGKMTLTTPSLRNTNTAFSSERKITKEAELGDMIRIDQVGHFEQGQSFPKEEFSGLGSGYGATHSTTVTVKEELDEAKYDTVRKLTLKERLAGVEPPDPALIGKYMPNYDYDDPIFAQFGITPMSTPRPVDGDPNQAAWDAQFQALFDQLNPKIRDYNEEVRAYNEAHKTPAIHPYTIQRRHILQSNVFMTSNQNGLIRSGQTMAIHGDVFNENSKLVAGSDMTITGALENPTVKAQEMTYTFGTDQSSYTYKRGWPHKSRRRGYNSEVAVTPTIQLGNPAALGQAGELSHTNTAPAGKDITASKRADVAQVLDPFTPTKAQADNTSVTARVAPIEPITLPSLYFVHPESTAKYLVETDSRFTNKKEFLSSDYMIYQLGWNPDRVQKKLGDGFYEQSLIRDQVMALTGKRYIDGYSNDEEGYKALMDQGVAFAKQYNLTMGVSLTKEQMAQLTSDIVWLESKEVTVNGETYTVLYPHVYMQPGQTMTLETDGSLISGKNLVVKTTKAIENEGTLLGDTLVLTGSSIRNSGLIAGGSILANSTGNIESIGQIRGTNRVQLLADEDIAIHNTINQYKNQEAYNQTAGIAVTGNEGVLLLGAKKDLTIQGAVLQNLGTNGSTVLQAGQTVSLMADTVSSKKAAVLDAKNYSHSYDRLDSGATIQTSGDLAVVAGDSIQAKAATLQSEAGAVQLVAGKDISLTSGEAIHNQDYGISYKSRGLLSSKKTTIQTESRHTGVLGTNITGQTVALQAGRDVSMTAAQIGSLEGTTIEAGSNIRANSAEQYDYTMADVKVKKSGIMGSGMGFMIGTKKSTDTQSGSYITQVGTTIGSVNGNTQIKAGDTVHLTTTNVVSGQDVIIGGQDVILDGAYNTADENYYAKRSSSGLTVSLGGVVPSVLQSASNYISQGNHRDNTLLGTLEYGEAAREIHKGLQAIKDYQSHTASALQASLAEGRALQQTGYSLMDKGLQEKSLQTIKEGVSNVVEGQGKELAASQELSWQQQHPELAKQEQAKRRDNLIHLQIGVGAHTSSQSQSLHSATYTGGTVISKEGQISITATSDDDTKGTIQAVSEAIRANTVLLQASKDISLESATHTQRIEEQSSNSGASLGVNLGTTGILGIEASVSRGRGNTVSQVVTHAPMTVEANEDISVEAGRDISLVGATLQGDRAIVKAGQNLTIQSVQDKKDYTSKTKETGLSVSIQPTGRIGSIGGAHNIGETQSQYASVTSQAGIYAGADGLTVDVGDTTQLTGAVLHSEAAPSKNVVKTGTLVMEDIHNVAEYTSKSKGFSYVYDDEYEQAKRKLQAKEPLSPGEIHTLNNLHNQVGLLPDLSVGTHKKETSVTQSAITDGQLLITDGVIDIETINRDTTQSLHRLQDIFDAKSVKEKEALARLLSKNINEGIHILSEHKHWAEGSPQKIALHALSAGLSAQVAKGDFLAGAVAGGTNEALLPKLQQMLATDDPAVLQATSAILGYATNKTLGKDGQTGAALAQYGTKWNLFGDGHPGQKMTSVAVGIEPGTMGHVSLIIGFEDGTYEEANYGRYGGDGNRISSGRYASPIGSGTYAFDYKYYLGKDNKEVFFLNLNSNDIAYWYNNVNILGSGYYSYNPSDGIIIGKDLSGKDIYSGGSYRNGSNDDYHLLNNSCLTTTFRALYGPSGKDNDLLNQLYYEKSPWRLRWLLENLGQGYGLVSWVYKHEE